MGVNTLRWLRKLSINLFKTAAKATEPAGGGRVRTPM